MDGTGETVVSELWERIMAYLTPTLLIAGKLLLDFLWKFIIQYNITDLEIEMKTAYNFII